MNLEHAYERWEQKVKARSHREGNAEGKAVLTAPSAAALLSGTGSPRPRRQRPTKTGR